jgi:hypothetical protein
MSKDTGSFVEPWRFDCNGERFYVDAVLRRLDSEAQAAGYDAGTAHFIKMVGRLILGQHRALGDRAAPDNERVLQEYVDHYKGKCEVQTAEIAALKKTLDTIRVLDRAASRPTGAPDDMREET